MKKETKTYYVFTGVFDKETLQHDYVVKITEKTKDETVYELFPAPDGDWCIPLDESMLTLIDDGNHYKVEREIREEGYLDFDEALELSILLNFVDDTKLKVVEEKDLKVINKIK